MKKSILTLAAILMITLVAQSQGRFQTFEFQTLDGIKLELKVLEESEIDEPLPVYDIDSEKNSGKSNVKLVGEKFDLSKISTLEKEVEETVIDTKKVFQQAK